MNGIHDLGGMAGFGSFELEANEPTFHEPWEEIVFLTNIASIAMLGAYNADEYRHSVERMPADEYLPARYYERTLIGVTTMLIEKGLVDKADLDERAGASVRVSRAAIANTDDARAQPTTPKFVVGDQVRVRDMHPPGHTRVPQYVRGHSGTVLHVAPPFKFPDASAHDLPYRQECTYHVAFDSRTLWSESTEADDTVVVDLWESYLEELL
jgi:nitrile hydratase beta subunit